MFLLLIACSLPDAPSLPDGVTVPRPTVTTTQPPSLPPPVPAAAPAPRPDDPRCKDRSRANQALVSDCVTATIRCGETIQGDTEGGRSRWGGPFYREKFCLPMPDAYAGPERVYRLELPANQLAEVRLESPCADLDLFAVSWPEKGRCPDSDHLVAECDASARADDDRVRLYTDHNPRGFLIAVDGKGGDTAPFSLAVTCQGT